MPAPRFTPAQRQFGIGLTPTYDIFRPPEGMELDPAYSPATRQQQGLAMTADLQRQAFKDAADEQAFARQQRMDERRTQQVEQQATEALRGASPDEIPNILAQFPELARSKNLGGFTNFAQAVTPSAGQKTLAPSLRNRLKPHERQYFDEQFTKGGDAVSAFDAAQLRGEHENGLVDMMKSGVPLDVIDKYRDRPLSPIEREAIVQQHSVKGEKDDHRAEAMKDSIRAMYDALPDTDEAGKPIGIDEVLRQRAEIAEKAKRAFYPEKFQQTAPQGPVAGQVQQNAAGGATPIAQQQVFAPSDPVKEYESMPPKSEEDFVKFAGRKDATPEFRQKVLQDLSEFVSKPVPQAQTGTSVGKSLSRDERIAKVVKTAEKSAARADEDNLYRQAWDNSKLKIDQALATMSEASGYSPEQLAQTIKSGERVRFKIDGKTITPKEWLESLVGGKFYDYASPFKQWANTSTVGQMSGKLAAETWKNVFDSYLDERTKPVAIAAPAVNVTPTGNPALEAALQKYAPK